METETLSDRENLFKEVPFRLRPINLRTRSGTNQYEYLNLTFRLGLGLGLNSLLFISLFD